MADRILIAEDEPFIVESLTFILKRQGFDIQSVSDGLSVFDLVKSWSPNLLILDVMLPEMNGFDVLRQVRSEPESKDLPVLILTAKGQDTDREKMMELGANDFVTKPFSNSDLINRVAALLQAAQDVTSSGGAPSFPAVAK